MSVPEGGAGGPVVQVAGVGVAALGGPHPAEQGERRRLTGVVRRRVATLARRLVDGPVDLYADLAADLPLLVLARLVELPTDDVRLVKDFSRQVITLAVGRVPESELAYLGGSDSKVYARRSGGAISRHTP